MKTRQQRNLRHELAAAGADKAELAQLLPIATALHQLAPRKTLVKAESHRRWLRIAIPVATGVAGLGFGALLIMIASSVMPTSKLYPVQKFSDAMAIRVDSSYRATVMMKRAEQVHSLVAQHADSARVLATLADYTNEAGSYQAMPHASYAAFEYCTTSLEQAAKTATPQERQAITSSLHSLSVSS